MAAASFRNVQNEPVRLFPQPHLSFSVVLWVNVSNAIFKRFFLFVNVCVQKLLFYLKFVNKYFFVFYH